MHSKLKTWNPEIGNWNPHPLTNLPFMPFQCWHKCHHPKFLTSLGHNHMMLRWHKCCHPKSLTSLGCHHMTIWWCHDLFWWESVCMCLVNWVGIVTLSGDTKADALITPCKRGELAAQAHTMTLSPRYLNVPLHQASQGTFLLKHVEKFNMCRNV